MEIFDAFFDIFIAFSPYFVDTVVIGMLLLAFLAGWFRHWRRSLLTLILQLGSLLIAFGLALPLSTLLLARIPGIDSLLGGLEIFGGLAENLLRAFLVLFLGLLGFALWRSFLQIFARNMDWASKLFPKFELPDKGGRALSGLFTALNAYTYLLLFVIIMAVPGVEMTRAGSFSDYLFRTSPVAAPVAENIFLPLETAFNLIDMVEESEFFHGGSPDYDRIAAVINEDPERIEELKLQFNEILPTIPEDLIEELETRAAQGDITPEEIRQLIHDYLGEIDLDNL